MDDFTCKINMGSCLHLTIENFPLFVNISFCISYYTFDIKQNAACKHDL